MLFDSFANAHNGYGDFVDLQAATVADCAEFFDTYYAPANAVLTVCGDFDVAAGRPSWSERHFDDIPFRPAPVRPSFAEPWPTSVREADHIDQHAPSPALAVGWRLPDPVADLPGYLAFVVLASILTDGESSRLQSTVVAKAGLATDIWASPGLLGGPLDSRDPDVFVLGAIHPIDVPAAAVIDASAEQIGRVAADGPEPSGDATGTGPVRLRALPGQRRDRQPHPVVGVARAAARSRRTAQRAAGPAVRADRRTTSPPRPRRWTPIGVRCCGSCRTRPDGVRSHAGRRRRSDGHRKGRGRCPT